MAGRAEPVRHVRRRLDLGSDGPTLGHARLTNSPESSDHSADQEIEYAVDDDSIGQPTDHHRAECGPDGAEAIGEESIAELGFRRRQLIALARTDAAAAGKPVTHAIGRREEEWKGQRIAPRRADSRSYHVASGDEGQ